jgi:hypothetical protein
MFKRGDRKPTSWGKPVNVMGKNFERKIQRKYPELKKRYTPSEWAKIKKEFWGTVADVLINQPNGIVLDGIGYVCFPAYTKKSKMPHTNRTNFKNKGLLYYTQFFGHVFNNFFLRGLSFELVRTQKNKWKNKVNEGYEYKCHYKNIDNIIGNGEKHLHPARRIYR